MLRSILLSKSIFLFIFVAFGGVTTVGNGGDVIVCDNPYPQMKNQQIMFLDLYETHEKGWQVDLGDQSLSYMERAKWAIDKLGKLDETRHLLYLDWLELFEDESEIAPNLIFPQLIDEGVVRAPGKNCRIEQIVFQRKPEFEGEKLYRIKKELWDKISENSKAALIVHEIVYREAIMRGHTSSTRTRKMTQLLLSHELTELTVDEYIRTVDWVFNFPVVFYIDEIPIIGKKTYSLSNLFLEAERAGQLELRPWESRLLKSSSDARDQFFLSLLFQSDELRFNLWEFLKVASFDDGWEAKIYPRYLMENERNKLELVQKETSIDLTLLPDADVKVYFDETTGTNSWNTRLDAKIKSMEGTGIKLDSVKSPSCHVLGQSSKIKFIDFRDQNLLQVQMQEKDDTVHISCDNKQKNTWFKNLKIKNNILFHSKSGEIKRITLAEDWAFSDSSGRIQFCESGAEAVFSRDFQFVFCTDSRNFKEFNIDGILDRSEEPLCRVQSNQVSIRIDGIEMYQNEIFLRSMKVPTGSGTVRLEQCKNPTQIAGLFSNMFGDIQFILGFPYQFQIANDIQWNEGQKTKICRAGSLVTLSLDLKSITCVRP